MKSLTTVFEEILSNFNVAHKEDNVPYLLLMGIMGKTYIRVKRQ